MRLRPSRGLAVLLATSAASAQSPPACRVVVVNAVAIAREQQVQASLPFARGELRCGRRTLVDVTVGDSRQVAPAVPLIRWEDGSVCVLQAHFRAAVPALGEVAVEVRPRRDVGDDDAGFPVHAPLLHLPLALHTELEDPWGRMYAAELTPDDTVGPGGVLQDSGAVRITALRAAHRPQSPGAGGPFLGLRGYLITFHGERRGELTLMLDNAEPPSGPLGPVRLRSFALVSSDDALRFLPAFAPQNTLPAPTPRQGGGFHQWLLPPSDQHYLGDGTAKVFRFHLFQDGAEVGDDVRAVAVHAESRLAAFPDLERVRASRAFGAHGGPAPRAAGDPGAVAELFASWRLNARFGPFGGFGDPEAAVQGSARQGDSALHDVLRWQSPHLLLAAEGMVLQHPLRPAAGPRPAPADTAPLREGLGPRALRTPHGFAAPDYEHFSALLLYDYFWLTGDPLARSELQRLGRSLRTLLPVVPFRTCRGEGQCLQSGVLIARATGDAELRQWLAAHFRDRLASQLAATSAGVLPQPAHKDAMDEPFDAVWQMAQLVRGLHALHAATGDASVAATAVRTADAMAGPGWLDGVGPKTFVSAGDSSRYTMTADAVDQQGLARMSIGAFVLAGELTADTAAQQRFAVRAAFLVAHELTPSAPAEVLNAAAANPWMQIALDRREVAR